MKCKHCGEVAPSLMKFHVIPYRTGEVICDTCLLYQHGILLNEHDKLKADHDSVIKYDKDLERRYQAQIDNANEIKEKLRPLWNDCMGNNDDGALERMVDDLMPIFDTLTAERDALKVERSKERVFVKHIRNHLKTMSVGNDVECRICDKTIDEIYEELKETPCES